MTTPAQKAGFEIGKKYKVLDGDSRCAPKDAIVTFARDDRSCIPYFSDADGKLLFISVERFIKPGETKVQEYNEEKTLDNLEAGDVVANDNNTLEIQGQIGKVYVTIDESNLALVYSVEQLKAYGYKPKTDPKQSTELTIEQIAEKFGMNANDVRIKDK